MLSGFNVNVIIRMSTISELYKWSMYCIDKYCKIKEK